MSETIKTINNILPSSTQGVGGLLGTLGATKLPHGVGRARRDAGHADDVRRTYGTAEAFLATFAPVHQARFATQPLRCYTGRAPTLADVVAAYGRETACRWLSEQIKDLLLYCTVRTAAAGVVQNLTDTLIAVYQKLRVTELMLFFMYFKAGRYGHFYGLPDPVIVTDGLCRFVRERRQTVLQLEQDRAEAAPTRVSARSAECCTWEEYMALRRRAEAGDVEAQQLLLPPAERTVATGEKRVEGNGDERGVTS